MKRSIPIFCVGICLVLLLQAVLMPKNIPEARLIGEYYANASGNDVIFVGDCEVYENISPITLYEEFGIASWIRGSPQQTVWQSFYLVEETLRYESPKAIVFNVLAMKYDTPESTGNPVRREAYNRITLDTMRWSGSKFRSIMASMTEAERKSLGLAGYLFPILRYHDRWSALTREDFDLRPDPVSHCGYLMATGVKPYEGFLPEPVPADFRFGQRSWEYLNKMVDLCREKGVQLVLLKTPSLHPCWWPEWEEQIQSYAQEKDLLYLRVDEEEAMIDWSTDTHDGGLHLNVYGAEKASRWLGNALKAALSLPDRREEESILWEERIKRYHYCREVTS